MNSKIAKVLPQYQKAPRLTREMNGSPFGAFGTGFRTINQRSPGFQAGESSLSLIFSFLVFLFSAKPVFGQSPGPAEDITGKIHNPILPPDLSATSGMTFLQNILRTGISLAFVVGGLIFFFLLLTGAIKWMSAGGDKGRLEGAQKQITHALVGLAILFLSFAIIGLMGYLFGIDLLKISLPTL